ncbi:DUF3290 family protein [Streptococcus australis]|uniref:DUF3290 family protein n=1 Tax=Streptococcus TaxID=1301 RepID=UPI00077943F5|nr:MULTISPECIES: DUF3290 family protein [Streptococcus]AMP66287.1 hypothetical protein ATM98_00610 [Streptococcus sp. A12]MBZ2154998.1 DUF3290 family protein [Streptococcus australis]RSK11628.1 hypothetical protein D8784_000571 [Streptococcus australis]
MRFIISFITFCGLVGVWYFIKKQPNIKYRNISVLVSLISFAIFGLFFREEKTQQTSVRSVVSSSSSSSSLSTTTQASSSTSEVSSSTLASKKFNDEGFQKYASQFQNKLNEMVKETGQVYSATGRGLILYLTVPQDFKYNSKDNIQEFADKVLQVKNETFPVWLVENGYSAQDVSIRLHIKTEDGTTIAKEKILGSMKVTK